MAWLILFVAGLLEVVWAVALKQSKGLSEPGYLIIAIVSMLFSLGLLAMALRTLPLSVGYAVWTGIGVLGAAVVGILWLGEGLGWMKALALLLLASGIVLLKLSH
ncbi:multidrug efflux SMR transporter [Bowmanella sp. Y26]|uniref:DMT family transporter n=1 Tax=Bowmanella yangjiangensis TaxID=2811230 RepID=UPI001BDCAD24|nr:multidrug efflux SMR transporter [Bowmanella yangjiangensis]MBT1066171.1 multidrug efflux SMR transporter [Bowmanella yangjiangensis]